MSSSIVYDKAYSFSIDVINVVRKLQETKREFVLSKQLLRSGTSIGANISEALGGISNEDFSYKMSISYKECLESKYWISLLYDTEYISKEEHTKLYPKADEIARILYKILKTTGRKK